MIGNVGKSKICLNLAKSFCGDGAQYKDIVNELNQIKSVKSIVKIEGTFIDELNNSSHSTVFLSVNVFNFISN